MTAVHAILPTNITNESGKDCKIERDVDTYITERYRETRDIDMAQKGNISFDTRNAC